MGLEAVVWAFDPLQATNAAFNLGVLGATCRTYEVDMYGARTDTLNAGLATDRLLAEWSTSEEAAPRSQPWPDTVDLIEAVEDGTFRRPRVVRKAPAGARHVMVEIPPSIADVKSRASPTVAREWQLALRGAFVAAFNAGFVGVGFTRADPDHPRYLLERAA
jgi:predicted GNAT superfamily acetyltransferase